jgi:hypothetical protein
MHDFVALESIVWEKKKKKKQLLCIFLTFRKGIESHPYLVLICKLL